MLLTATQNNLINRYKYLPYYMANKFADKLEFAKRLEFEDLVQEGFLIMCKAAQTYNPSKSKFVTYAYKAMMNRFKVLFGQNIYAVTYPQAVAQYGKTLPAHDEVFGKNSAIHKYNEGFGHSVALKEGYNTIDKKVDLNKSLEQQLNIKFVRRALDRIAPEKSTILKQRFGIEPYSDPMSLRDLAKLYNITIHSVEQRIYVAKKYFRKRIGEQIDFYI